MIPQKSIFIEPYIRSEQRIAFNLCIFALTHRHSTNFSLYQSPPLNKLFLYSFLKYKSKRSNSKSVSSLSLFSLLTISVRSLYYSFRHYADSLTSNYDPISFSLDSVSLGDLIYDDCLQRHRLASVKSKKYLLLFSAFLIISRYLYFRRLLSIYKPTYVLVSHRIGSLSGPLCAASESLLIPSISHGGVFPFINISCFKSRKTYEYTPSKYDLFYMQSLSQEDLVSHFEKTKLYLGTDALNPDSKNAYTGKNLTSREQFLNDHGIRFSNQKICFVMMHAFTDHPHSHFRRRMLFDDYYDWYKQTRDFAISNKDIVFVFKEHPSSFKYPTNDFSFDYERETFSKIPNIIFLDASSDFNNHSIKYLCDLIITCMGSAGFEYPALYGIRTLVAAETQYSSLGFCLDPRSQSDYFNYIRSDLSYTPLTSNERITAFMAFNFMYKYSKYNVSAIQHLFESNKRYDYTNKPFSSCDDIINSPLDADIVDFLKSLSLIEKSGDFIFSTRTL